LNAFNVVGASLIKQTLVDDENGSVVLYCHIGVTDMITTVDVSS